MLFSLYVSQNKLDQEHNWLDQESNSRDWS